MLISDEAATDLMTNPVARQTTRTPTVQPTHEPALATIIIVRADLAADPFKKK